MKSNYTVFKHDGFSLTRMEALRRPIKRSISRKKGLIWVEDDNIHIAGFKTVCYLEWNSGSWWCA